MEEVRWCPGPRGGDEKEREPHSSHHPGLARVMGTWASDRAARLQRKWTHLFSGYGEKQRIYC